MRLEHAPSPAADVFAGTCAIAIGIGLARFDFSIVAKQMATIGWIETASIGDLSGSNLIGYLAGCFHQSKLRHPRHVLITIALALAALVISLLAESFGSGSEGQALWRFLGGWGSAQLMTGVPSLALQQVNARRLRLCTSILMAGAGVGGLLGALVIGQLAPASPSRAWVLLAGLALLLSLPVLALLKRNWQELSPAQAAGSTPAPAPPHGRLERAAWPAGLIFLAAAYALAGAGSVPSVLYEPLLLAQRFSLGPVADSHGLAIFGAGATTGSLLVAFFPKSWPTRRCLLGVALIGALAAALFALGSTAALVGLASFLLGCWSWMIVSLTYLRIHAFVEPQHHRRCWATLTLLYISGLMIFSFSSSGLTSTNLMLVLQISLGLILLHALFEVLQMAGRTTSPLPA